MSCRGYLHRNSKASKHKVTRNDSPLSDNLIISHQVPNGVLIGRSELAISTSIVFLIVQVAYRRGFVPGNRKFADTRNHTTVSRLTTRRLTPASVPALSVESRNRSSVSLAAGARDTNSRRCQDLTVRFMPLANLPHVRFKRIASARNNPVPEARLASNLSIDRFASYRRTLPFEATERLDSIQRMQSSFFCRSVHRPKKCDSFSEYYLLGWVINK